VPDLYSPSQICEALGYGPTYLTSISFSQQTLLEQPESIQSRALDHRIDQYSKLILGLGLLVAQQVESQILTERASTSPESDLEERQLSGGDDTQYVTMNDLDLFDFYIDESASFEPCKDT